MKKRICNYKNLFSRHFKTIDRYIKMFNGEEDFVRKLLLDSTTSKDESFGMFSLFNFYKAEKERKLEHLFIQDDDLFEFFENTNVKLSENLRVLCVENEFNYFVIHSKTRSFGFVVLDLQQGDFGIISLCDADTEQEIRTVACVWNRINDEPICKMAMNILLYMSAFPDKIKVGVPIDYKVSSVGSIKNKVIGKSEKIISRSDSGKSTHFRSGFFRYYPKDSQHWKNVAGTSIWVDATVVNGKAKTIKE